MYKPRPVRSSSPTNSARSVNTSASNATRASKMNWGEANNGPPVIITKADMKASLGTYERLLATAKTYRNAMLALASATSNFASALEECARQKGAAHTPHPPAQARSTFPPLDEDEEDEGEDVNLANATVQEAPDSAPGERLMAAAGLHHVMSNQQQLLSDTFYKSFEIPLIEKFDNYRREVQDRTIMYEKDTEEKSKKIRDTEAQNMRDGRKKQRDLASFRRALQSLQSQVDDLDRIKSEYYHEVLAGEQETWEAVSLKVALVVRSQIDSADRIVTKGSSEAMIEGMVQHILDPFNVYGPPKGQEEGQMFSVLTPLGISSPAGSGSPKHPAYGLARSRLSTPVPTQEPRENGTNTAQRVEEQKLRMSSEADVQPKRERNELAWGTESESGQSEEGGNVAGVAPSQQGEKVVPAVVPEEVNLRWPD